MPTCSNTLIKLINERVKPTSSYTEVLKTVTEVGYIIL